MKWVCCADRCMWQTCTYIWLTQSWQTYTCIHLTNPVLANMCIHLTQSWQTCAYIWLTQSWQTCTIYVWLTQFWRHDCFLFLHLFKVHTNLFPCACTVHCMQHVTCFTSDLLVSYKCDRQCVLCCVQRGLLLCCTVVEMVVLVRYKRTTNTPALSTQLPSSCVDVQFDTCRVSSLVLGS